MNPGTFGVVQPYALAPGKLKIPLIPTETSSHLRDRQIDLLRQA